MKVAILTFSAVGILSPKKFSTVIFSAKYPVYLRKDGLTDVDTI